MLHPWAIHSGINTDHYENYDSTVKLSAGPQIFMPTEFLHGLYDGGIGAGLRDYWDVMGKSPTVGGGFFWAFADEGIRRTDRDGRIDTMGNAAPDGMFGPDHEKEGSFFTVKQIWSPVQVHDLRFSDGRLAMRIENLFDFLDLQCCSLRWRRADTRERASASVAPRPPGTSMRLAFRHLAADEMLELTVLDGQDRNSGHGPWPASRFRRPVVRRPKQLSAHDNVIEPASTPWNSTGTRARWRACPTVANHGRYRSLAGGLSA